MNLYPWQIGRYNRRDCFVLSVSIFWLVFASFGLLKKKRYIIAGRTFTVVYPRLSQSH